MSDRSKFDRLQATSLYCKKCGASQAVEERLLLVLPDRELYEYLCKVCGEPVGSREVSAAEQVLRRETKRSSGPQVRFL